jgi:glycosyltransferase involved in cell wall biosynthesis
MNIFVVIPAYNEQPRLGPLLWAVKKYFPLNRVVVVDDGSDPPLVLEKPCPAWLLRHRINLGKGSAMKTGAEFAFKKGAQAVIFMDADLQHDPRELPVFVEKLTSGIDMVFGSRRPNPATGPADRAWGNRLACLYMRLLFGVGLQDILSGYRAMDKKAYDLVAWQPGRYEVETEMIARFSRHRHRLRWTEIPIETIYIDKYKGISPADSVKILARSLWWKLSLGFR